MGRYWSEAFKRVTEADLIDNQIMFQRLWKSHAKLDLSEAVAALAKSEDERIFNLLIRKLNPMRGQA